MLQTFSRRIQTLRNSLNLLGVKAESYINPLLFPGGPSANVLRIKLLIPIPDQGLYFGLFEKWS